MFMGSQQITGTKEMEAFCQQQAIVASAATVSGDAVTGDTVVSGGAVASGASVVTQGAFVADGISYKITGADTVTVNGLESNFEKTVLQIPEQVAYQQQTFTVTSVEMNQLQQCYENVKKIVIPKTVTENVNHTDSDIVVIEKIMEKCAEDIRPLPRYEINPDIVAPWKDVIKGNIKDYTTLFKYHYYGVEVKRVEGFGLWGDEGKLIIKIFPSVDIVRYGNEEEKR